MRLEVGEIPWDLGLVRRKEGVMEDRAGASAAGSDKGLAAEEGWRGEGWRLSVVEETCKGSDFQPPLSPWELGPGWG